MTTKYILDGYRRALEAKEKNTMSGPMGQGSTHFPDGHERKVDEVERPEPLPNFYDQGWNARVAGKPFTSASSRSWQDGWKDCDSVPEGERFPMGDVPATPTETHVDAMVQRFLSWPLPAGVCSDLCVTDRDYKFPRSGTNLLTAAEARQMVRHLLGLEPR